VPSTIARVYRVELDRSEPDIERLSAVLTPVERDAPVRTRVARAAARIVLGNALGIDPGAVPISRRCEHCGHATHGRPVVGAEAPVAFNVSHSGELALIALLDQEARIGVDIETVRPRRRLDGLAERVLAPEEYAAWARLTDQDARLRMFLDAWTRKEAYLKARGVGIITPLRDVPRRPKGWTVDSLFPRDGFMAAVAVDRPGVEVEQRDFTHVFMSSGGTAG
jgi:4'-phosphopantetheinyl transferase